MCGIAGYITARARPYPASVLRRMNDTIAHRGPDGFGFYEDDHAALGHRRLSIIDLTGGGQPMANEDESLWIVYNGEIFNHASLRPELEQLGHHYHSRCDTETIIHAWEAYGARSLQHYRGMFAFALWDKQKKTLFAARDRLGIKPFYYYFDGQLFAFASEIKSLLEHPAISPRFHRETLAEYMTFGYLSQEETMFAGVRQLMPGHWLQLDVSGDSLRLNIHRYWEVPFESKPDSTSDAELIADCRRRLEETVRMRLMSDVPLGMFLSGGVDSSAIAALVQRMAPGPLNTFSVGYREDAYSELGYAREVATHLGTQHHEVVVSGHEFFEALPRLIWHEDEPITWPSSVSLYFVSRLAASMVKVVLTGEGSDELFGGYGRYRFYQTNEHLLRYFRLLPGRRRLRQWIASTSLLPGELRRKLQHTVLGRAENFEQLYLDNFYGAFSQPEQSRLGLTAPSNPYANVLRYWNGAGTASTLGRLLYTDQKTYLVELLRKQDRMSMACSIESRVPFLDHHFVEFSWRIRDALKINGAESKSIFKKSVEDILPHSIIYRKKMGFPTPLKQWLASGDLAAAVFSVLGEKDSLLSELLDRKALDQLLARHASGAEDATDRIWRLLNLQLWGDVYFSGRREARWEGFLSAPARS
ncbi:MAG: asparagine synthase (glutamine-hydrolyzing) [Bryobacteraceae bacterium]